MARLNQPADFSHATPAVSKVADVIAGSEAMSSPVLRPLSFEASLQSHGADQLPPSPLRRSSGQSPFSPADCRTLERLLRSTSVSSPPETPSPLEQSKHGAQLLQDTSSSPTVLSDRTEEAESYQSFGGETTDTGYEDEDDSMELSEGTECAMASDTLAVRNDPTLPYDSKYDRRLQESVSTHDEKERQRYSGQQTSIPKQPKSRRRGKSDIKANASTEGDAIRNGTNLPGERVATSRHSHMIYQDGDQISESADVVRSLRSLRPSLEKTLNGECAEEERTVHQQMPGFTVDGTREVHQTDSDEFKAVKEDSPAVMMRAQRRKNSQNRAPKPALRASPGFGASQSKEESQLLVLSTYAAHTNPPDQMHVEVAIDQNVPETPFAKTLGYFKQFKGTEIAHLKRRRNTALFGELVDVSGSVVDETGKMMAPDQERASSTAPDTSKPPMTTALADLEGMMDTVDVIRSVDELDKPRKVTTPSEGLSEELVGISTIEGEPTGKGTEKQVILYPQHPTFVNAIGMIPATMFWVAAAPIVKYTGMTVDLLMDKLRETYF